MANKVAVNSADPEVRVDALDRAKRTITQGLVIDLAVALGLVLAAWVVEVPDDALPSSAMWLALGVAVGKSFVQAFASWLMRLRVAPSETP